MTLIYNPNTQISNIISLHLQQAFFDYCAKQCKSDFPMRWALYYDADDFFGNALSEKPFLKERNKFQSLNVTLQRGKIPLLLAVETGNQSMCRELLSQCASEQLRTTTPAGDTALHLAARRRDVDMVRILVDYGTPIDMQNVRHKENQEFFFLAKRLFTAFYYYLILIRSIIHYSQFINLKIIDHSK